MGAEPGGNQARWAAMRARKRQEAIDAAAEQLVTAFRAQLAEADPIERFAQAVSAAVGKPKRFDAERAIREGKAMVAEIQARKQAAWDRNATARERGLRAYEAARARYQAERGEEVRAPMVTACAWLMEPFPVQVF